MSIALASSGHLMLSVSSFVGMEDTITEETFIWAFNDPKIIRASAIIGRLMNDIVSHKVCIIFCLSIKKNKIRFVQH